jgi:hypothetical protein
MLERGVTKMEVEEAIARPLDVRDTRQGRKAAFGSRLDGGFTIVIFEESDEGLIVITALKTDNEGAKRYGFTGI